jgi:hypothetical protein
MMCLSDVRPLHPLLPRKVPPLRRHPHRRKILSFKELLFLNLPQPAHL